MLSLNLTLICNHKKNEQGKSCILNDSSMKVIELNIFDTTNFLDHSFSTKQPVI